jgi:diguanylate cyclase (GGDEF)-like protein
LVSDASADTRFKDNPLVTSAPGIRVYAGYPLKVKDDAKIGTLCLIDQIPRDFTSDDQEALRDLAAMVEKELVALQMATMDELTQLTNRHGLVAMGQNVLNLIRRLNTPALVSVFDLDGFKAINDTFGHAEGDFALKAFARILGETFREADVVSRLGGDEFVTIMANCDEAAAEKIIGRLECNLTDYNKTNNKGYEIRVSVGHVRYDPNRHQTINLMIADADAAMYRVKINRKNPNPPA